MSGTYSITGQSGRNLRVGAADYRSGTSPFEAICMSILKISEIHPYNTHFEFSLPSINGKTFDGWYLNNSKISNQINIAANDNVYYSKWS